MLAKGKKAPLPSRTQAAYSKVTSIPCEESFQMLRMIHRLLPIFLRIPDLHPLLNQSHAW